MINYTPVPPGQSVSDSSIYDTSFVVSCSPPQKSKDGLTSAPPGVIYANSEHTLKFVSNPIQTDVTQAVQCDVNQLLKSNPDINGLSLTLDTPQDRSEFLDIEDFLPPSQYHDIFDIIEFSKQAERSFFQLPASLRKLYNNDPMQLCAKVEQNDSATLAALNEYIYGLMKQSSEQQSGATASRQGASSTSETSDATTNVVEQKTPQNQT